MLIEAFPRISAVLLDFDSLMACGFSWPDFHSEVGLDGKHFDERPDTIVVDFSGGSVITPDTTEETRARMRESTDRHEIETSVFFGKKPVSRFIVDPLWRACTMGLMDLEHCGFVYTQWETLLRNAMVPPQPWLRTLVIVTPDRWTDACRMLDSTHPATIEPAR